MNSTGTVVRHVRDELNKVVVGQEELVTQALATILCGGHALIEGVPGVAKTLTVKCLAQVLGVTFRRVQCNSDLMPADIIGTNLFDAKIADFTFFGKSYLRYGSPFRLAQAWAAFDLTESVRVYPTVKG
jgi:MoxR-like ATPase